METIMSYSKEQIARQEFQNFIDEGLKDVEDGNLLDFDTVFDELEVRYHL